MSTQAVAYHPFSDAVIDDPFPIYRELRDQAPALYLEEFDCWFLSRFEDIWKTLENADALSNKNGTTTNELLIGSEFEREAQLMLSNIDRPEHTQIRKAIAKHFHPSAAAALEDRARGLVRQFLDDIYERGEACAIHDIAMRLSVRIALTIIGIPLEEADRIVGHVNAFFDRDEGERGFTDAGRDANERLFLLLGEFLEGEMAKGGSSPLMQALFGIETDAGKLTIPDLLSTLQLLVVGGTETLPKVFAGTVHRLWQNPDQRARVAADPKLAKDAFWEGLRYDMPTNMLGRTLVKDIEVHGQRLRAGQKLMFLWHCANHDEREFPDPERFDIERRAKRVLSFGHAVHRCLGANIAQMEGRVLVEELLARIPEYEVDEKDGIRLRSEFFQGWGRLPIRWTPR